MKKISGLKGFMVVTACLWLGVVGVYAIQTQTENQEGKKAMPLGDDCGCTCSSSSSSGGEP